MSKKTYLILTRIKIYLTDTNFILPHFDERIYPLILTRLFFSFLLKNFFIQQNPNKEIPFVMEHISYKKGTNVLDESQQFQLCVDLLNEGYSLNIIETDEISKKLNTLSESYNNRLKFFKVGTNPKGFKIKL